MEEHLKLLVKVVPQKDVRTLELQWAVPPSWKVYQHAPCHYVSHLLGHEGKGSPFALLKEQGYATGLRAGEMGESFSGRYAYSRTVQFCFSPIRFHILLNLCVGFNGLKRVLCHTKGGSL